KSHIGVFGAGRFFLQHQFGGHTMVAAAKKTKILIVEDDKDTALTLSQFLAENGFEAVSLQNRDDAARGVKEFAPDIILMDYWMTGMSASVFVNRVRSSSPCTKIIVITALHLARSVATMLDADGYFGKPIDFDK